MRNVVWFGAFVSWWIRILWLAAFERFSLQWTKLYQNCLFLSLPLQFVSHPNVQQLLASIWYEGLPGFRRKNMALQSLEICRIGEKIKLSCRAERIVNFVIKFAFSGMLFPIFSFAYILAPHSSFGQTMRKPFIKFICHSASYFTFLCK